MSSFSHMAVVEASTKRSPGVVSGKRAAPEENIESLNCTPLDPVDPELRASFGLSAAAEVLQTFVEGSLDIVEGDVLVVDSNNYPVRAVADWYWPIDRKYYRQLILEQIKT